MRRPAVLAVAFLYIAACGSSDPGSPDAADPADAPDADAPDADADALAAARDAARTAAHSDPACTAIAPFYWEIGDVDGALVDGAEGTGYAADTTLEIASATKWLFGAYVVERFRDDLAQIDHAALTMQSGLVSFSHPSCVNAATVASCFAIGDNATVTAEAIGHFDYGGGHFQKYAIDLGLGDHDNARLAAALTAGLGDLDLDLGFASPQPAGGATSTPAGYARFLRAILAGELAIHARLGADPVCTRPGPACPDARSSPIPAAWHYSYGHWIEDDDAGDGAFSSAGYFGFYPWIDAARRHYGIVARRVPGGGVPSAACGRAIRAAFLAALPPGR